jgi:hypothetical protein
MRRAGPERVELKKTSSGRVSELNEFLLLLSLSAGVAAGLPRFARDQTDSAAHYTGRVGEWYRIGLTLGLGTGIGVALAGVLARSRAGIAAAVVLAAAAGAAIGFGVWSWHEGVAGAAGGAVGVAGAAGLVLGALRRGGTRGGTAMLVVLAGIGVAALALVPALGYVEAVAVPLLGLRLRRRSGGRYAGLRILARD